MSYDAMRHFADSYGLIFIGILFLALVGWTFRRGSRSTYDQQARMIFDEKDEATGKEESDG